MEAGVRYLWLIPTLPLAAAAAIALLPRGRRKLSAALAIGSMGLALLVALLAFGATLGGGVEEGYPRRTASFVWFALGEGSVDLGWVLDPLSASMAVMVCLVGLLIFIYSVGYMAHDANFTRFFGFLALFASAMLGVVIANSLLLLFICWELVGLSSYLLIGFWYHKPSAAAAAKKAFVTTRVGDLGLLLGMVWLYAETGTLLFYDGGGGCLEQSALARLVGQTTVLGMGLSTAIGLLIFCGAVGKSGQVPLHVWLPDAMEGPTPVSALIHAATMVAAGVFLVARVYPLMGASPEGVSAETTALQIVAWTGAVTALFAALIAVAQTDIKRILAYSTVSQLGFMMIGLGTGGVAVGFFHLITHAFFKALLFLGAGSVIHGLHDEQDIRRMGGVRAFMPVTFATYAVGMMALSGVPLLFSGFWSKDEILHAAHGWAVSSGPFYLGVLGALLTAFYMTRQMLYVFFGRYRGSTSRATHGGAEHGGAKAEAVPHESPAAMTGPLAVLAAFAVLLGFWGTPAWPWFQSYLEGETAGFDVGRLLKWDHLSLMLLSSALVAGGIWVGWRLYGRRAVGGEDEPDALELLQPGLYRLLARKFYIDELYGATVVRLNSTVARLSDAMDRWLWGGLVALSGLATVGLSWVSRVFDEQVINAGFDQSCSRLRAAGGYSSRLQDGQIQNYLRVVGVALSALVLMLTWGHGG